MTYRLYYVQDAANDVNYLNNISFLEYLITSTNLN
jgi:hypothetical protein